MLSLLINIFSPHTRVSRLVVHRNGGGPEQRTHTQHSALAMDDPLKQKVSYPREVTTGEYGLYTWGWGDFGVLGNDGCRPMPEPVNVAMNCPTTPALHESSDMAVACGPSHTIAAEAGSCFVWGKRFGGKKMQLSAAYVTEGDLDKAYVIDVAAGKECAYAVGGICPSDGDDLDRALRWQTRLKALLLRWPSSAVVNQAVTIVARQVALLRQKVDAQRLFDGVVFSWGCNGRGQLGRAGENDDEGEQEREDAAALSGGLKKAPMALTKVSEFPAAIRVGALALVEEEEEEQAFDEEAFFRSVSGSSGSVAAAASKDGRGGRRNANGGGGPHALRCPHKIVQLSAGMAHVLALSDLGVVLSWGDDEWGQLGTGGHIPTGSHETPQWRNEPAVVSFPSRMPIASISAGWTHSLAVPAAGRKGVFVWGCGDDGRLGTGTTRSRNRPTVVPDLLLKRMLCAAGGKSHTLFITAAESPGAGKPLRNTLWVCGQGSYGQLGLGDDMPTQVARPRNVRDINKLLRHGEFIASVAAGSRHSLATTSEGGVIVWGWGNWGESGMGDCSLRSYPWRLPGFGETAREMKKFGHGQRTAKRVACGARHSACVASRSVERLAHKRAHTIEVVSAQIARGEHRSERLSWKKEPLVAAKVSKRGDAKALSDQAAAMAAAHAPLCVCVLHCTSVSEGHEGHLTLSCPSKGFDVICAPCAQRYLSEDDEIEVVVSDQDTICSLGMEVAERCDSLEMLSVAVSEVDGVLKRGGGEVAPSLQPPRQPAAEFQGHAVQHHNARPRFSFRKKGRRLRDPSARVFWDQHRRDTLARLKREVEEKAARQVAFETSLTTGGVTSRSSPAMSAAGPLSSPPTNMKLIQSPSLSSLR